MDLDPTAHDTAGRSWPLGKTLERGGEVVAVGFRSNSYEMKREVVAVGF